MPPQLAILQVAGQLQSACQQRNAEQVDKCLQSLCAELRDEAKSIAASPRTAQLGMKELLKLLFILRDARTIVVRSSAADESFQCLHSVLSSTSGFEKVERVEAQLLQLFIEAATCTAQSMDDILARLKENPHAQAPKKLLHLDLTCSVVTFVTQQLQEHPSSNSLEEVTQLLRAIAKHIKDSSSDQQGLRAEVEVFLKALYSSILPGMTTNAPSASQPVINALLLVATGDQALLSVGAKYLTAILRKLGLFWKSDCSAVTADTLSSISQLFQNMESLTFQPEHVELFDTAMAISSLLSAKISTSIPEFTTKLAAQAWELTCSIPALERFRGKAAVSFSSLVISVPSTAEAGLHFRGKQSRQQWMQALDLASYSALAFHLLQSMQSRVARLATKDDKTECLNHFIRCVLPDLLPSSINPASSTQSMDRDVSSPAPEGCPLEGIAFAFLGHRHGLTVPAASVSDDLLVPIEQRVQTSLKSKDSLNPREMLTVALGSTVLLVLDPLRVSALKIFLKTVQLLQVRSSIPDASLRSIILAIHLISFEWLHVGLALRFRNVDGLPFLQGIRRGLPAVEDTDLLRAECAAVRWAFCLDSFDKNVSYPAPIDCPIVDFIRSCSTWLHDSSTLVEEVSSAEVQASFEAAMAVISSPGQHFVDGKQMQALLHLIRGRVQFLRCQKVAIASRSAKYALHYLQSDLMAALRVDALLLLMELHDFVGRLGRALDYMAEVESLCQNHKTLGPMLRAISSLHTARILYRCQSRQLPDVLKSIANPSGLLSVYHPALFQAAARISEFVADHEWNLSPSSSDRKTAKSSSKTTTASLPAARSLHLLWGLFERRQSVCSYTSPNQHSWDERLASQERLSFDRLRTARRGLALEALERQNADLAFVLAAASIGTSNELQLLSQAEEMEDTRETAASLPSPQLLPHCTQVRRACLGGNEDMAGLCSQLQRLPKHCAFCFICLDDERQEILFGRCERSGLTAFRSGAREWSEVRATLGEFAKSMQAVDDSLRQTRSVENAKGLTAAQKKNWWAERENVDQALCQLTERMEAILEPHLLKLLAGALPIHSEPTAPHSMPEEDCNEIDRLIAQLGCTELDSDGSFEADASAPSCRETYEAMKIVELRDVAKRKGLQTIGRKAELVDRLVEHDTRQSQSSPSLRKERKRQKSSLTVSPIDSPGKRSPQAGKGTSSETEVKLEHIVFMLDESLQSFPVEALPMLRSSSVSRVPSLPLLLSLLSSKDSSLSPSNSSPGDEAGQATLASLPVDRCWYAVDVESNLPETRKTIQAFLQPLTNRHGWKGTFGAYPPEPALRDWNSWADWYIYCGHGAGEKVLASLDDAWNHRAALLWGCSSVRLIGQGVYDPHGAVLAHLQAGCQLVVGNLWDVTDRDLDKLSISCMEAALRHVENPEFQDAITLPCALRTGREACKMRYAVASAAVVYGFPLSLSKEQRTSGTS